MVKGFLRSVAAATPAAVVAWFVYGKGGLLLLAALLALLCAGFIAFRWLSASRARAGLLHDPAMSSLVFPPESRMSQATRPPH